MQELISANARVYLAINTSDYNQDGAYAVSIASYDELPSLGWEHDEEYIKVNTTTKIAYMEVGDLLTSDNYGAYLMRIA